MNRMAPGSRCFGTQSRSFIIVGILIVATAGVARSEPFSLDPEAKPAELIEFKSEPGLGDFVGRVEGTVDSAGRRFYLKGLDITTPTVIEVLAKDPAKPIGVSLHRFIWRQTDYEGSTNEDGNWGYAGRIHDEVGIALKADEPSEFYVLAWMGPSLDIGSTATLFKPPAGSTEPGDETGETASSEKAGSSPVPLWALLVIIGLLAVIAFALMRNQKRGNAGSAVVVAAVLICAQVPIARADPFDIRLAVIEGQLRQLTTDLGQVTEQLRQEMQNRLNSQQRQINEMRSQLIVAFEGLIDNFERLRNHDERLRNNREFTEALVREVVHQLVTEMDTADNLILTRLLELEALVAEDRVAEPDPTYGGVPPVESGCVGNPACMACFSEVNSRLQVRLNMYEKLRIIYSTNKELTDWAIDLGNSMTGWHHLEQAAWFGVKNNIIRAHKEVEDAYRAKYEVFNGRLRDILNDFGDCEAQFGLDNWYDRYGNVLYNSLISTYRLP